MLFLPSLLPLYCWSVFIHHWENVWNQQKTSTYRPINIWPWTFFLPITRDRLLMSLSKANYSTHIVDACLLSCTRVLFQKAFSLIYGSTAFICAVNNLITLKKKKKSILTHFKCLQVCLFSIICGKIPINSFNTLNPIPLVHTFPINTWPPKFPGMFPLTCNEYCHAKPNVYFWL